MFLQNNTAYIFEEKLARFLSYLLHPLFVPTYGILLLYFSNEIAGFNNYSLGDVKINNYKIIAVIIVFTLFIPALTALFLKRIGKIHSLQMETRQERQLPFAITGFCYLLAYSVIQNYLVPVNQLILIVLMGAQMGVLLALLISTFWKISIHMIGIGGMVGMQLLMMKIYQSPWELLFYLSILTAGFLGFSRLRLHAHSVSQVLIGFILGVLTETIFLLLF